MIALFPNGLSLQPASCQGAVMFREHSGGRTAVFIHIRGLEPNKVHAIHIHEKQFKDAADLAKGCSALGGHFNPNAKRHGSFLVGTTERHAGDLCNNIVTDGHGTVTLSFVDPDLDLRRHDLSKRSIVVHEHPDDLGLGGQFISAEGRAWESGSKFERYGDMDPKKLLGYFRDRYGGDADYARMIKTLEEESGRTGNAGGRLICSNIKRMPSGRIFWISVLVLTSLSALGVAISNV